MKREKSWFYGIYGIEFVWRGPYSDPELIWHGHRFNYYDIEDPLWSYYREECEENGTKATEEEFSKTWVKSHAYLAREYLQNIVDARKGVPA